MDIGLKQTEKKPSSKKKKDTKIDFLHGSLWDKILLFALPIAATSVLQQLFNAADIAVVGHFVGKEALAAVGSNGPIIGLFITLFTGLSIGANTALARHLGSGDNEKASETVQVSVAIALIAGLSVMIVGELLAKPLLEVVGTPAEVIDKALLYLRIYFSGSIFLMMYNFESAIFRAAGDTKKPLYVLCFTGLVNVVLNLFFVCVLGMHIEGVALATLIANFLSSAILFYILVKKEKGAIKIIPSKIHLNKEIASFVLKIGIPSAAQGMLFSIANIVLQSGINSLGSDVIAGSTVGMNVEIYAYYLLTGFGQASITFNSQNLGAKNLDRCTQVTRTCVKLAFIISVACTVILIAFRKPFATIFTNDPYVIEIACSRILIVVGFEVVNMFIEVMSGTLRGLGYSTVPALLSIFFVCGVRISWLTFVFPAHRTFIGLMTAFPVSWCLAATSIIIAYFIVKKKLYASIETPAAA